MASDPRQPEKISSLVENAGVFECRGYTTIFVTRDNQPVTLRLPIKSTGVAEYEGHLAGQAPRPPTIEKFIKANSTQGEALGMPEDGVVVMFDPTDEKYIEDLAEHENEFAWKVAIHALDIEWKKADGNMAETYEEKKQILQSNGITGHQLQKIFQDIGKLSQYEEQRADFLSEN